MLARRILVVAALLLAAPLPASAALADHEPAVGALWLGVIALTALSWVMACRRWWLPLLLWVPVTLLDAGLIAHFIDPATGSAVRDELGAFYLLQAELCEALVVVVPLAIAHGRLGRRLDSASRRLRR